MSVYSALKMFHYPDKINSLPAGETPTAPLHVRIKPTNACNHSCGFCAYRRDDMQLGKDMNIRESIPEEKMMEIVEDLIEMQVKAVTFTGGGEPLVYRHIDQTALKLAENGIKFSLLTNGALLKNTHADIFSEHATWIRISMNGYDGESYARSRSCSKNEFENVLKNIEEFQKRDGKCYLGVSYIIDQESAPHVYNMTKRLKETGVQNIKLSPCIMGNTARESNNYHKDFFDKTKDLCQKAVIDFSDSSCDIFDSYHKMEDKFSKEYNWCPMIQIKPVIGADLNIYSCQDKAYNFENGLIGSIKNERFKNFWMNGKENFLRINPQKQCNNHCVVNENNKMLIDYLEAKTNHLEFV